MFAREARPSLLENSLRLTVNCRTTRAIHRSLQQYSAGDTTDCTGPEGRPPKRVAVSSDRNEAREVQRELLHLVNDERVVPSRVVILTPRRDTSHWRKGQKLGNLAL